MFKAILIEKIDDQQVASLKELNDSDLPDENVIIKIDYSTLNYKDALALTNSAPIVRQFPLVPGVDCAGHVLSSTHPKFEVGQKVVLGGWGVGEKHWGGLAEKIAINGDWLVPLPHHFSTRQAMGIATAGVTAMYCVLGLEEQGLTPDKGEVVVTGVTGGVGSVAVALLSKLGYQVAAVTGKPQEADYLKELGATTIIDRAELSEPGRPLAKERWAGAVDTVGSHILANICAAMKYDGVVTACGLAAGMDFPATVAPFILRGVKLIGIDSVMCPIEKRIQAWDRLVTDLDVAKLDMMTQEIGLSEVIDVAPRFISGDIKGRIVVDVSR